MRKLFALIAVLLPSFIGAAGLHTSSPFVFHPYKDGIFSFANDNTIYQTTSGFFWSAKGLSLLGNTYTNLSIQMNYNQPQFQYAIGESSDGYTLFRTRNAGELWVRTYQGGLPSPVQEKENRYAFTSWPTDEKKIYFWHSVFDPSTKLTQTTSYFSDNYGTTFTQTDLNLETEGAASVFLVPFIGKPDKGRTQSLYAVTMTAQSFGSWKYTWYRSDSYTGKFEEKINYEFPSSYKLLWLDVSPQAETNFWALAEDQQGNIKALFSSERARSWTEATLPAGTTSNDGFMINQANTALMIIKDKALFSINPSNLQTPERVTLPESISGNVFFGANAQKTNQWVIMDQANQDIYRSQDTGKTWTKQAPSYDAQWVSQTAVSPLYNAYVGRPGDTIPVTFTFKNTGTVAWEQFGGERVGLYVYKDPVYSWPYVYNDPSTGLAGQSYFADLFSWGPSGNGLVPNSRAALMSEITSIPTEKEATFKVTFQIPESAEPNSLVDLPETPYDDRFYREDLSLAHGTTWMSNTKNGDPFGNAHIWVPIKVIL